MSSNLAPRVVECRADDCSNVFEASNVGRGGEKRYCSPRCGMRQVMRDKRRANPDLARKLARDSMRLSEERHIIPARAAMLLSQGGKCAVCETSDPGPRGWQLDHDHKFKRTDPGGHRGVLCMDCNVSIGRLGDDLAGVLRAVAYLQKFEGK
jgi:hypothetical protein